MRTDVRQSWVVLRGPCALSGTFKSSDLLTNQPRSVPGSGTRSMSWGLLSGNNQFQVPGSGTPAAECSMSWRLMSGNNQRSIHQCPWQPGARR